MTVRPILFSAPMIRALLEGRKTQTRRVLKPQPELFITSEGHECEVAIEDGRIRLGRVIKEQRAPYAPGDVLWVRETWSVGKCADGLKPSELSPGCWLRDNGGLWLEGNDPRHPISPRGKSRPSIFMPRRFSRLTLAVTGVKVERLQDISEADAEAEGVTKIRDACHVIKGVDYDLVGLCHTSAVTPYAKLWETINGPGSWESNPWVVAVSFTVHSLNVDAYLAQRPEAA